MIDPVLKVTLQKKYGTEQVYTIPFSYGMGTPDKFSPEMPQNLYGGSFTLRSDAEYNEALIQIIPYILVINKAHNKMYVTKRIAGEERLKDSLALGCGGHINPEDFGKDLIFNAAYREMNEELNIRLAKGTDLVTVGTVRDLNSATREHLGVVMIATAGSVSVKEKENLKGIWMTYNELVANYSSFESWAKHILDYMFDKGGSIQNLIPGK